MPKSVPVAIFDCVVFGATGDLTLRKLLPGAVLPLPRRADSRATRASSAPPAPT